MLATVLFGASLIAFSLSRTLWLSLVLLPFVGAGFMVQMAGDQHGPPDDRDDRCAAG